MASFLQSGGYDHHVRKLRRIYAENCRRMSEVVSRCFPEGSVEFAGENVTKRPTNYRIRAGMAIVPLGVRAPDAM